MRESLYRGGWQFPPANIAGNSGEVSLTLSFDPAQPNEFNPAGGGVPGMSPAQYGIYEKGGNRSLEFSIRKRAPSRFTNRTYSSSFSIA
jgi:hypothetical protein